MVKLNVVSGAAVGTAAVAVGSVLFPAPAAALGVAKVAVVAVGMLTGAGVGFLRSLERAQGDLARAGVRAMEARPNPQQVTEVVTPLVEVPLATMAASATRVARVTALTIITAAAGYLSQQPTCLAPEYAMSQYVTCYSACAAFPICGILAIREAVRK